MAVIDKLQSPYIYQNGKLQEVNGRLYEYDAAGNTVADGKATYLYNAPGRLTKATILGVDYQYTYNYLGQRVVKKSSDTTRVYHYDLSGLVLAESDGAGNTLVEYVYLNGKRLALIAEQVYYVHANHIDAPLALTDQNGDIVWQANYTPFGVVNITTNLLSEEMTARFPGQYADSESGLYYNYFRDYDPELGRYIQSDPIGLAGGINTYGYVGGNPVNFYDPLGLNSIAIGVPTGIGVLACSVNKACMDALKGGLAGLLEHLTKLSGNGQKCETFYRGDDPWLNEFWADAVKQYANRSNGVKNAETILNKVVWDSLYSAHADSSQNSPFISITTNKAIAEIFAGDFGEVYKITLPHGVAIPNPYSGKIDGVPENEYLVPIHIPSQYVNNPCSCN